MTESEGRLLDRARKGDPGAFSDLVRPLLPAVRRFAQTFARRGLDSDDLAQEALLKAYCSIGSFRGESKLSTWLFTVTRSVGLDLIRSREHRERRLGAPLDDELRDDADGQESLLDIKDEAELLWAALRHLEPEFRVVVVLADIEGCSYEEIAEIERVPVGTVRSRLSRGRDRLAAILERLEGRRSSIPGTLPAGLP